MSKWEEKRLEDIIDVNPPVKLKKGESYPFIDIDKVSPTRRSVTNEDVKIYDGQSSSKFCDGDTVFSRITPCLENRKIAKVAIEGDAAFGSTEFYVFRAKKKKADARFTYYLTSSDAVVLPAINSMTGASGRQRADKRFIQRLKLNLPDLPTQERIADILSTYDDLIESNNRRIELLEQTAQELYKEWFVRFRFPGYENAKFEDGMPEGWECCRLGKILSFGAGKTRPKSGETYPVYGGNGILDYCNNYNSENAIIIGRVGVYCGTVYYEPDKCWISDNALFAESKNSMHFYNYYLLKNMNLNARQIGTGQPLITQGLLNKIRILLPAESLMMKYNQIASELLKQQDLLRKMNVNIAAQRDMLLPRLMSGKLEV